MENFGDEKLRQQNINECFLQKWIHWDSHVKISNFSSDTDYALVQTLYLTSISISPLL